jgi:hypothetical protein
MEKQCTKCGITKPITDFYKDKNRSDGYFPQCKQCVKINSKRQYNNNKKSVIERVHLYREVNTESVKERELRYRKSHREEAKERTRKWKQAKQEEWKIRYGKCYPDASGIWRHTPEAYQWTKAVYNRDNHTCQHCGKNHCKVHAHHIKAAKDYPDLRYDLANGICLCAECHKKEHSI